MTTTLRFILLTAVRDRLFLALALLLLTIAGLAIFLGDGAVVEPGAARVVYAGMGARLVYVLGLLLFVSHQVRRIQDSREIEVMLSRPLSRVGFVVGCYLGFALVALLLAPLPALIVWMAGPAEPAGLALWTASLLLEGQIVVALGLFFALILASPVTAMLAAVGFYVFARISGAILGVLTGAWIDLSTPFNVAASWAFRIVSTVMPRLDLFGQTQWLAHGPQGGLADWAAPLQTACYVPLLLAMAIYDFQRKQF